MAQTINPAVSGSRTRWLRHSGSFFAGVFLGSLLPLLATTLAVAGLIEMSSAEVARYMVAVLVLLAILRDLGVPIPLPYRSTQVPEWLRDTLSPGTTALVFGAMLGAGFLTLFTYSTHLAFLLVLPFVPDPLSGIIILALFAVGKTLVLVLTWDVQDVRQIEAVTPAFRWSPIRSLVLRATTAATSGLLTGVLLAAV